MDDALVALHVLREPSSARERVRVRVRGDGVLVGGVDVGDDGVVAVLVRVRGGRRTAYDTIRTNARDAIDRVNEEARVGGVVSRYRRC